MKSNISFTDEYLSWLKKNMREVKIGNNVTRITMPFLDNNNDYSEFYIISNTNGTFSLSDDGSTIFNLESSGVDIIKQKKRKEMLNRILSNHGVQLLNNSELSLTVGYDNLPQAQHTFLQCILKINDLFYLVPTQVKSFFVEDVKSYFDKTGISYFEDASFIGKSNLYTTYDFVLPHNSKSSESKERFIKLANNIDRNLTQSIVFAWEDTKIVRKNPALLLTIINDSNKTVSSDYIKALRNYEIEPIMWSNIDEYKDKLIA